MTNKAASQAMVGDMNRYTQMAMADSIGNSRGGSNIASDMMQLQMGMQVGQQMMNNMNTAMNNNANVKSIFTLFLPTTTLYKNNGMLPSQYDNIPDCYLLNSHITDCQIMQALFHS